MKRVVLTIAIATLLFGAACRDSKKPVPTTTTTTSSTTTSTTQRINPPPSSTTTTQRPTTTTQRPTTTTTKPKTVIRSYEGIYPFSNNVQADQGSDAWEDPVYTARRFLVDYVGFTRLVMGTFRQSDSRSGEVTARSRPGGPVTTIFVRKIGQGDNWTVVGAFTDNIRLFLPQPGQKISSPVHIEGESIAFEGTVLVEVRQDGQYNKDGELGFKALTGHGTEVGPLVGDVPFKSPTVASGAVIAYTDSAEDGHIQEVSAHKVLF